MVLTIPGTASELETRNSARDMDDGMQSAMANPEVCWQAAVKGAKWTLILP